MGKIAAAIARRNGGQIQPLFFNAAASKSSTLETASLMPCQFMSSSAAPSSSVMS
jgi:hypothetical protein